jgi:hypothetical protein
VHRHLAALEGFDDAQASPQQGHGGNCTSLSLFSAASSTDALAVDVASSSRRASAILPTEAGFANGAAYTLRQGWHVANVERYIESILTGTVRARAVLASQSDAAAAGVRSYIVDYLARFRAPGGELVVPMPAIIGSGVRPG